MDFIELNGTGLRYELSGKGDRTLVLVHEMGGSLESWDDVVPRFTGSRRVLRYDTRGAGLSQKVRGQLSIDTMADDIAPVPSWSAVRPPASRRSAASPPLNGSQRSRPRAWPSPSPIRCKMATPQSF